MDNKNIWIIIGVVLVAALLVFFYMQGSGEIMYDSAEEVDDVSVELGTSESDVIDELAEEVTVTSEEDQKEEAEVDWEIEDYNAEEAGDYSATGELDLPSDWSGSPDELEATVTVKEGKDGNYQAVKEQYMKGCNSEGDMKDYCECTFDYIYDEGGVEAFMEDDEKLFEEAATECIHLYEE